MMRLIFGEDLLTLPGAVLAEGADADLTQLRVLLWLASDHSLLQKPKQLAKLAECDQKTLRSALAFWQSCGVLTDETEESVPCIASTVKEKTVQKKETAGSGGAHLSRADELPNYTSSELADLLEKREEMRVLIDESQRILGKIFTTAEVNVVVGMRDYLEMSAPCILLILAHCKKIGKTGMRYIEKFAIDLSDRGIRDEASMDEELQALEASHTLEGEVRSMFGIGRRSLTGKEKKMLRDWISFGYGAEVIGKAYEATVTATNEPSIPYANAVLVRWHEEGLCTPEQVDDFISKEKEKRSGSKADRASAGKPKVGELGNSFDTDDFFEAALKRSFEEPK